MQYKHEYGVELEGLIGKIGKDAKLMREFLFDILSPAEYRELAKTLNCHTNATREIAKTQSRRCHH